MHISEAIYRKALKLNPLLNIDRSTIIARVDSCKDGISQYRSQLIKHKYACLRIKIFCNVKSGDFFKNIGAYFSYWLECLSVKGKDIDKAIIRNVAKALVGGCVSNLLKQRSILILSKSERQRSQWLAVKNHKKF